MDVVRHVFTSKRSTSGAAAPAVGLVLALLAAALAGPALADGPTDVSRWPTRP